MEIRLPIWKEVMFIMALLVFVDTCSMYYETTEPLVEDDAYMWEAETSGAPEGSNWDYAYDEEYHRGDN